MGADYNPANKAIIGGCAGGQFPPNTTAYLTPIGSSANHGPQVRAEQYFPYSGIVSQLRAHIHQPPGAGETFTLTLMVNGIATALTCQIAGAVATEAADLVNQVAIAAGDYLTLRIVSSLNAAAQYVTWAMQVKG